MVRVSTILLPLTLTMCSSKALVAPLHASCVSGLYIISARGSNEAPGEGRVAQVSTLIKNAVPGSASVAVDYPAIIFTDKSSYPESVMDGVSDTKAKIESYVDACGSSSRIVLLGYSQGGNVMTDLLAGGVGELASITSDYVEYIKGVAVFGDPTFAHGQTFNAGNDTNKDGLFTRLEDVDSLALLNSYASILRSYCDANDIFCADGSSLAVHRAEVANHAQEAADFIISIAS